MSLSSIATYFFRCVIWLPWANFVSYVFRNANMTKNLDLLYWLQKKKKKKKRKSYRIIVLWKSFHFVIIWDNFGLYIDVGMCDCWFTAFRFHFHISKIENQLKSWNWVISKHLEVYQSLSKHLGAFSCYAFLFDRLTFKQMRFARTLLV